MSNGWSNLHRWKYLDGNCTDFGSYTLTTEDILEVVQSKSYNSRRQNLTSTLKREIWWRVKPTSGIPWTAICKMLHFGCVVCQKLPEDLRHNHLGDALINTHTVPGSFNATSHLEIFSPVLSLYRFLGVDKIVIPRCRTRNCWWSTRCRGTVTTVIGKPWERTINTAVSVLT